MYFKSAEVQIKHYLSCKCLFTYWPVCLPFLISLFPVCSLCKEENLTTMLSVITSEPTETTNEMERFKNANLICEIFTYEGNPFIEIIVNNDKFMTQLWSFVSIDTSIDAESEQPTTLNPLLASFFTKVFLHLFTHKLDMVMDFLGRQEPPNDFVSIILRHINVSAIMDLMFKTWEYVQMDRKNGNFSKYNEVSFLFTVLYLNWFYLI